MLYIELRTFIHSTNIYFIYHALVTVLGFPGGSLVKNLPANAGDARDSDLISGSGRSPGAGSGNLLQYSCLENSMDRGGWWALVHGAAKSQTQLSNSTHTHTGKLNKDQSLHLAEKCSSSNELRWRGRVDTGRIQSRLQNIYFLRTKLD